MPVAVGAVLELDDPVGTTLPLPGLDVVLVDEAAAPVAVALLAVPVLEAPDVHVAAVGRFVTPLAEQRASANLMVSVRTHLVSRMKFLSSG